MSGAHADGVLTLHRHAVKLTSQRDAVSLIPIGDVHRDSDGCDVDLWKARLRELRARDQSRLLYIGVGDMLDMASFSERREIRNSKLHDTTRATLDKLAAQSVKSLASELDFTRGHWLGMLAGNHGWEFQDGTTTASRLAAALDAPLFGSVAYVVLSVGCHDRRSSLDIVLTHGRAGGKLAGTTINQVADLRGVFPEADLYIMGHDHQRGCWPQSVLRVQTPRTGLPTLHARRQWLCRSGSYLRAYAPGVASYAAARLLRPADLGGVELEVRMERHGSRSHSETRLDVRAVV